jgi:hypothetical protein
MSKIKKVLIVGCSYSASNTQSGWNKENVHNVWTNILAKNTNWQIDNFAHGGCTNHEISMRAIENITKKSYDLCIIQWTSLHRLWVYEAENNIDNPTQILPNPGGWNVNSGPDNNSSNAKELHKLYVSNYLNTFVALKHWFYYHQMLQNLLPNSIFINASNRLVSSIETLVEQAWNHLAINKLNIPSEIKHILNFDNNPDDYLKEKLNTLIMAYKSIDQTKTIGYNKSKLIYGMPDNIIHDKADDGLHPGKHVNQYVAEKVLEKVKKLYK